MRANDVDLLRVEELLERSEWIRALAASLARDPDRAEDLAQSTIAVALEKRPASGVPLSRWIASVMRNLLRQDLRAARRRERREERAARPEATSSDATLLERLEVQRKVVEAVRSLDEPYRSAILLRYFEGLSPAEIAERLEVPVRTVHSRLNRGLQLLRQKLDAELGERGAWLGLILPMTRNDAVSLGTGAGGILVSAKVVLAMCATCILLLAAWSLFGRSSRPSPDEASATTSPSLASTLEAPSSGPETDSSTRGAIPASIAPAATSPAAIATKKHEGRVLDVQGRPVAGAQIYPGGLGEAIDEGVRQRSTFEVKAGAPSAVGFSGERLPPRRMHRRNPESSPPIATSDAEGKFSFGHLRRGTLVHARTPDLVPIVAYCVDEAEPKAGEMILLVAEPSVVAGVVVGDRGQPIAGAEVFVRLPDGARDIPGVILDGAEILETYVHSGVGGFFEIPLAPKVEGRRLYAHRGSSVKNVEQELSAEPETGLVVDLSPETRIQVPVRGVVLDERGSPVPDARVGFGYPSTRTDAVGRFVLEAKELQAGTELVAAAPLFVPARVPYDPRSEEYELRFEARSKVLAGYVLDRDGKPMRRASVRIADPTLTGHLSLEDIATNGMSGPEPHADTEADGHFVVGGLFDRPYELDVVDQDTLRTMRAGPFEAGRQDVEITFSAEARVGRVAGRVVDRSGASVARAHVSLVRRIPFYRETTPWQVHASTDEKGAFEFESVPLDVEHVRVGLDRGLEVESSLAPDQDLEHLVLVAPRPAHFRIDRSGSNVDADLFRFLDAAGNRLPIVRYEGSMWRTGKGWPITSAMTEILATAESAETLVLERKGIEAARIPIRLVPGEVTILRP